MLWLAPAPQEGAWGPRIWFESRFGSRAMQTELSGLAPEAVWVIREDYRLSPALPVPVDCLNDLRNVGTYPKLCSQPLFVLSWLCPGLAPAGLATRAVRNS